MGGKYSLLFLLGTTDTDIETNLREESAVFGDLLQLDIREEYLALPYKVLSGMVWVNR